MTNIDWENLACDIIPTDFMYKAIKPSSKDTWDSGNCIPYGNISLSPAAQVLNYGQGIFEGLKAQRSKTGDILLFRPWDNATRFIKSAENMHMTPISSEHFLNAVKEVVLKNERFIPPYRKGALYIRPCIWGTQPILNVTASKEYTLIIYASPVGHYLSKGLDAIRLKITDKHHRAAPKGMGDTKCIGNYPGATHHAELARSEGYRGCLYLDALESRYIEEAEAANFFCIKGQKLFTPCLGTIMPGITRNSIMVIAKEILDLDVVENQLDVEDALSADECFCSGTLAIITPVGSLTYQDKETTFNNCQAGPITIKLKEILQSIQLDEIANPFKWTTCI